MARDWPSLTRLGLSLRRSIAVCSNVLHGYRRDGYTYRGPHIREHAESIGLRASALPCAGRRDKIRPTVGWMGREAGCDNQRYGDGAHAGQETHHGVLSDGKCTNIEARLCTDVSMADELNIKVGDTVSLNSGGLLMTVVALEVDTVTCAWAIRGDCKERKFPLAALKRADSASPEIKISFVSSKNGALAP